MDGALLVAYATRYGSTKEVAEAVANSLQEDGFAVEIHPFRDVRTLNGFSGIVMGAPLQMFHWHPDAMRFINRFKKELASLPVVVFALGPFHNEEKEFSEARKQLGNDLANSPWFTPLDVVIFGGKYDPSLLTFPMNMIPAMSQIPASDIRDWDVIRKWAKDMAVKFKTGF